MIIRHSLLEVAKCVSSHTLSAKMFWGVKPPKYMCIYFQMTYTCSTNTCRININEIFKNHNISNSSSIFLPHLSPNRVNVAHCGGNCFQVQASESEQLAYFCSFVSSVLQTVYTQSIFFAMDESMNGLTESESWM